MKLRGTPSFDDGAKASANFLGTLRRVGQAFEQCAKVQASTGGDDGELAALAQIGEDLEGAATIFASGENFFGLDQVNEVVRNPLMLRMRNFSRADIEVTVNLGRIADQDFAIQFFGEFDAQRGFAGGGGTEDDYQRREATHPENFQRIKSPSMTRPARSSAPITWVRLIVMIGIEGN